RQAEVRARLEGAGEGGDLVLGEEREDVLRRLVGQVDGTGLGGERHRAGDERDDGTGREPACPGAAGHGISSGDVSSSTVRLPSDTDQASAVQVLWTCRSAARRVGGRRSGAAQGWRSSQARSEANCRLTSAPSAKIASTSGSEATTRMLPVSVSSSYSTCSP